MLLDSENIKELCQNTNMIDPPGGEDCFQGASYDMKLGEKCYVSSSSGDNEGVITLGVNESVKIPRHTIFMFQTEEKLNLPNNIVGKITLRMGLVRKGGIMPSQTQIDPGYNNYVFGMLYNLANRDVQLKRGEHIVSVEFYKLDKEVEAYGGPYGRYSLADFVSEHVQSSMDYLNNQVQKSLDRVDFLKHAFTGLTFLLGLVTVVVTVLGIYMLVSPYTQAKNDIRQNRSLTTELTSRVERLTSDFEHLNGQVNHRTDSHFQATLDDFSEQLKALDSRMAKQEAELLQRQKKQ